MRLGTRWKAVLSASAVLAVLMLGASPQLFGEDTAANLSGLPKLEPERVLRPSGAVTKLAWSSDGTKLAAAIIDVGPPIPLTGFRPASLGRTITVWEADGRIYRELRRQEPFLSAGSDIAFAAGDRYIVAPASYMSDTLAFSIFDLESGEVVREIAGPIPDGKRILNRAWRLATSPDQSVLAVAFQRNEQPIALYSTRDWSKLADLPDIPRPSRPPAVAFSKDGRILTLIRSGNILIYETASRQIVQRIGATVVDGYGFPNQVTLNADGSKVAVVLKRVFTDGAFPIALTDEDAVAILSTRDASSVVVHDQLFSVNGLTWSPNSPRLVFTTRYKTLHIRDALKTGPNETTRELSGTRALALSPDGRRLAVDDGENVRIFRIVQ